MRRENLFMKKSANHLAIQLTPLLLAIIILIVALLQTSNNLYIPALPAITTALNSNTSTIQMSLSSFMIGISASHLFYGPLSDKIGRKKPILLGIGISLIGSFGCLIAPTAIYFICGRLIEGFGVGCCNSVGRSIARDLLNDRMLAKISSYLGMVSVCILAISPTIGGYIAEYLGWRYNFVFLLSLTLIILILIWKYFPETNRHIDPNATKLVNMKSNYLLLLQNKPFLGYTLCSCCASAGLISYFTMAPFLLQNFLGLTQVEFGWLAFVLASGIFISGWLNSILVVNKGISIMVFVGCMFMLTGGIIMSIFSAFGVINAWVIMISIFIFSAGAGLTYINAFAGAFHHFPKIAGTAGALYGFLQDASASVMSLWIATIQLSTQFSLAVVLFMLSCISIFAWKYLAIQ